MSPIDYETNYRNPLNAEDLGIGYAAAAENFHGTSEPDADHLESTDPKMKEIERLLDRFGGVILAGPPGTSKSLLAGQAADILTDGNNERREDVQFHPSYQFEDFMEGYRPDPKGGGFELRDGTLLRLAKRAHDHPDETHVLVIDELSRADAGRVFGEALTYIEKSKRFQEFSLPSDRKFSIPTNFYIIATMNPYDRGVDDIDIAFERRFARIDMQPSREALIDILDHSGFPDDAVRRRLLAWFDRINKKAKDNPSAAIGHAYFAGVSDISSLRDIWNYQLKYHVERAFKLDKQSRDEIVDGWGQIADFDDSSKDVDSSESPENSDEDRE